MTVPSNVKVELNKMMESLSPKEVDKDSNKLAQVFGRAFIELREGFDKFLDLFRKCFQGGTRNEQAIKNLNAVLITVKNEFEDTADVYLRKGAGYIQETGGKTGIDKLYEDYAHDIGKQVGQMVEICKFLAKRGVKFDENTPEAKLQEGINELLDRCKQEEGVAHKNIERSVAERERAAKEEPRFVAGHQTLKERTAKGTIGERRERVAEKEIPKGQFGKVAEHLKRQEEAMKSPLVKAGLKSEAEAVVPSRVKESRDKAPIRGGADKELKKIVKDLEKLEKKVGEHLHLAEGVKDKSAKEGIKADKESFKKEWHSKLQELKDDISKIKDADTESYAELMKKVKETAITLYSGAGIKEPTTKLAELERMITRKGEIEARKEASLAKMPDLYEKEGVDKVPRRSVENELKRFLKDIQGKENRVQKKDKTIWDKNLEDLQSKIKDVMDPTNRDFIGTAKEARKLIRGLYGQENEFSPNFSQLDHMLRTIEEGV